MRKINYDKVQEWIKEAGYECGKNTAMVDVFYRFANIVLERTKSCEPALIEKPAVKIEKASEVSSSPSVPSPLPSSPSSPTPVMGKTITVK